MKRALIVLLMAAAGIASAQTTYRWTDPATGRTIFSDQPPPAGVKLQGKKEGAETGDEQRLSYATRLAAEKFPVILFTSADCVEQCNNARNLLNGRGVPFQEKIASATGAEADELKTLTGGEAVVPVVVVGRQNFKGFEANAWNNLLDLAGYPKTAAYGSKPSGAFAK
jgi:glutaredoxin